MPYVDGLPAATTPQANDLLVLCQGSTGVPGSGTDAALKISTLEGLIGGVTSLNTRSGAVTLLSADVTSALAFTPYSSANPSGYQTAAQVAAAVTAGAYVLPAATTVARGGVRPDGTTITISGDVISSAGSYTLPTASTTVLGGVKVDGSSVTISGGVISASGVGAGVATFNTRTGAVVLGSADVTAALTFTPYDATNPGGYQTAANVTASLASYALTSAVPALAPVQSVATRTGAVTLTHTDLTDWATATAGFGAGYSLPTASTTVLGGVKVDGTSVTIASGVISAAGGSGGGAVSTPGTSQTLTSASSRAQSYAFTAAALTVTLPNATTLSAGGPVFSLYNAGSYTFGVLRADGTLLTAVPPGACADLYLDSAATSAGVWHAAGIGLQSAYEIVNASLSANLGASPVLLGFIGAVAIYYGSGYVQAFDTAGGTAGTANAILGVIASATLLPISSTQAVLVYYQASTIYGCVLTMTGTSIGVGLAASVAAGTPNSLAAAVTLVAGTSFLVAYNASSTAYAVQLGVSGTTATFGSAVSNVTTNNWSTTHPLSVISSTQVFGVLNTTTNACFVIGISGTTVTMNSAASATTTPTKVLQLSNTLFVTTGAGGVLQAFSVSGTTTTAGTQLAAQYSMTTIANMIAAGSTAFMAVGYATVTTSNSIAYYTISGTTITAVVDQAFIPIWMPGGATAGAPATYTQVFTTGSGYVYVPNYGLFYNNGTTWTMLQPDLWPDQMASFNSIALQDGSGGVMFQIYSDSNNLCLAAAQTASNLLVKPGRINPLGLFQQAMSGAISAARFLIGTSYPGRTGALTNSNVMRCGVWMLGT